MTVFAIDTANHIDQVLAAKEPLAPSEIARAIGLPIAEAVAVLHRFDGRFERVAGDGCWWWRRLSLTFVRRRRKSKGDQQPKPAPPPRDELCERVVAVLLTRAEKGLGGAATTWIAEQLREHTQDVGVCLQRNSHLFTVKHDPDHVWTWYEVRPDIASAAG